MLLVLPPLLIYNSTTMEDATDVPSLSIKVLAIAAGEAHTLLLTGDGHVYSWGRGTLGRLGVGSEQDKHFPVQVKFGSEDSVRIVGIAAGAYHSLALADDGSVWCWGYNVYGQLGIINGEDSHELKHADGDYSVVPCLLNKFLELHPPDSDSSGTILSEAEGKTSLKICSVKAGGMMSISIDNLGALWMWGNCPQEIKEGGFSVVSNFTPIPVWDFHGHTVVNVACGNEHVIALVSAGELYINEKDDLVCYSWGNNSHGQLGLGDKGNRAHPQVMKTFDQKSSWAVYEVACGAFHTALLTKRKKPNDDTLESVCWTFGLGDNGQLGHGTTQSTSLPEPVKELPQPVNLVSVDCGLFHTCVVSSAGDVWSWGMEKGLGLYPDARTSGKDSGDALSPLLMPCNPYQPRFLEPVVQVACGAAHTVIVAHDGHKLWSWGRGRSGVLGNGKATDCYTPTIVLWPPLVVDFKQEDKKMKEKETERVTGKDEKLSSEVNELEMLRTKLSIMKRYASVLHDFIFGKPFDEQDITVLMQNSGSFSIAKEWEKMLEAADYTQLVKMEMHFRNMHADLKDRVVKRRINEITKESLKSSQVEN